MDIKEVENAASKCLKNGIKVYPVVSGRNHKVEYSLYGVPKKRFDKILDSQKSLDEAIKKTYLYLAKKGSFI